ncbi:MAG: DUF1549 and DUF1553 domain-containing protein [Acidobacteriota bacterium]|nr:DUF1549 and DUF1553 domain-containing protein [Acidobacteriota bacterium]
MPNGKRETLSLSGSAAQAKRLALVAFVVAGLLFSLDRFGAFDAFGQRAPRQAARQAEQPSATIYDCSYVKRPEDYIGTEARHRSAVSQVTEAFAASLAAEGVQLVPPQQMPRKNIIDDLIFGKMAIAGIQSAPLCTDEEFLRRATLDLTGRIPSADDVTNFLKDQDSIKRDVLLDKLIYSPEFNDKWAMFFGDLYKNTAFASNINRQIGGAEAMHKFIYDSLVQNKSYAEMATEMITARGDSYANGPVNFIVGSNVPMGPAQDTYDGLAVQTGTIFLGLSSMDCLLCHDGAGHLDAVNLWGAKTTRADAYGLSAFFARTRRANVTVATNLVKYNVTEATTGDYTLNTNSGNRQNRTPIGAMSTVPPKYMFGAKGGVTTGEDRRTALARYITQDPQFARAIVNYIWEELMVEGFVSPSDTFDLARLSPGSAMPDGWELQPTNPELLDALAQDFSSNGYDLRRLIKMITLASTYQLSSKYPGRWKVEYVPYYARKYVRRLRAEELHDAIVKATNLPPVTNAVVVNGVTVSPKLIGFPIMDETNAKLREVQWAMQLPDTAQPRVGQADSSSGPFLNSFLRGNRDTNARVNDASILQALNMMNNTFIQYRVNYVATNTGVANTRGYIDPIPGYNTDKILSTVKRVMETPGLTNEQIITQLYLNTLSRSPTQKEITKILPFFTPAAGQTAALAKQRAIEGIQWVLLNKVDFLFNY